MARPLVGSFGGMRGSVVVLSQKTKTKREGLKRKERIAEDKNEPQGNQVLKRNVQMAKSRAATAARTSLKSGVAGTYDIMIEC